MVVIMITVIRHSHHHHSHCHHSYRHCHHHHHHHHNQYRTHHCQSSSVCGSSWFVMMPPSRRVSNTGRRELGWNEALQRLKDMKTNMEQPQRYHHRVVAAVKQPARPGGSHIFAADSGAVLASGQCAYVATADASLQSYSARAGHHGPQAAEYQLP